MTLVDALHKHFPKDQVETLAGGPVGFDAHLVWDYKEDTVETAVRLPPNDWGNTALGFLSMLLGCPSVVQSWDVSVPERWRGRGLGKLFLRWKMDACRAAGKTSMIATVANSNAAEQHILEGAGWRRVGDASAEAGLWMVCL
jgi:GNAT superfamily N-acetyltransferase